MPYKIQKRGSQFCVVRKDTGESKGCSASKVEAQKHLAALYANEPKAAQNPSADDTERVTLAMRHASTAVSDYKPRRETFDGRPHLAVPVVMLVEGVVHAINAETPELVTAKEFGKQPNGWNGRPLYYGHPMKNGKPVSGNLPEVLAKSKVGTLFNVKAGESKLQGEAWVDEQNCKERAPELLERVLACEPIEISVGTFVDTTDEEGEFEGKKYKGVWKDMVPDHLALLPKSDEGACSMSMGCGIRAAKGDLMRQLEHANQYTNGTAAAAHEAAAQAHEAAAKAGTVEASRAANVASGKANNESNRVGVGLFGGGGKAVDAANKASDQAREAYNRQSNAAFGTNTKTTGTDAVAAHQAAADAHRQAAAAHMKRAQSIRAAYSEDQPRDEKGRFGSAAANHDRAANAHAKAAIAHNKADAKSSTKNVSGVQAHLAAHTAAHAKTLAAEKASAHANASSKNLVSSSHGTHATNAARTASNASRAGNHGEASSSHRQAADYHMAMANLIRGTEKTSEELRNDKLMRNNEGGNVNEKDRTNAGAFVRMMEAARSFFRVAQPSDEMSDSELRKQLLKALQDQDKNVLVIECVEPVTDPNRVIYRCMEPNEPGTSYYGPYGPSTCLYAQGFDLSKNGVVTLKDDAVEVQPITTYEELPDDEDEEEDDDESPEDLKSATADLKAAADGANQYQVLAQQAQTASTKAVNASAKNQPNTAAVNHNAAAAAHSAAASAATAAGDTKAAAAHQGAMLAHTNAANAIQQSSKPAPGKTKKAHAATQAAVTPAPAPAAPAGPPASGVVTPAPKAAQGEPTDKKKPCGCNGAPKVAVENKNMKTREERIAKLMDCSRNPIKDKAILESLTDAQLKTLRAYTKSELGAAESQFKACASKKDAEAVITKMADAHNALHAHASVIAAKAAKDTEPAAGEDKTAGGKDAQKVDQGKTSSDPKDAQAKTPTFAELLAAADPDTRAAIEVGRQASADRKSAAIKSLKANPRNKFTEETLKGMSQEQLDNLVALSGGEIRDFSGAGTVRVSASEQKEAPAAPDLGEALRAARAKK